MGQGVHAFNLSRERRIDRAARHITTAIRNSNTIERPRETGTKGGVRVSEPLGVISDLTMNQARVVKNNNAPL